MYSRRNIAIAVLVIVSFAIGIFMKNIRLGLVVGLLLGLLMGGLAKLKK